MRGMWRRQALACARPPGAHALLTEPTARGGVHPGQQAAWQRARAAVPLFTHKVGAIRDASLLRESLVIFSASARRRSSARREPQVQYSGSSTVLQLTAGSAPPPPPPLPAALHSEFSLLPRLTRIPA